MGRIAYVVAIAVVVIHGLIHLLGFVAYWPLAWDTYHGVQIPSRSSVTWADEGTPWLVIELDDVVYDVDVEHYIRAVGP